jgi:3-methyladenine DNA glycosylase AlkC
MTKCPPTASILARRGATTTAGVPREVRELLDTGRIETVNLCEWLVVDQARLVRSVFGDGGRAGLAEACLRALDSEPDAKAPARLALVARAIVVSIRDPLDFGGLVKELGAHPSDIVRAWGALTITERTDLDLKGRLARMRPFATDRNMSVREVAWMGMRPHLVRDLRQALANLLPWVRETDANLRRFASESTRPRGVWCSHIRELKENPGLFLELLEPLRADPSKYVRDSVANWLNDASKSRPDWVRSVCERWLRESPVAETQHLVRRALRTLRKSAGLTPPGAKPRPAAGSAESAGRSRRTPRAAS